MYQEIRGDGPRECPWIFEPLTPQFNANTCPLLVITVYLLNVWGQIYCDFIIVFNSKFQ